MMGYDVAMRWNDFIWRLFQVSACRHPAQRHRPQIACAENTAIGRGRGSGLVGMPLYTLCGWFCCVSRAIFLVQL